jgi:hypothetical protein
MSSCSSSFSINSLDALADAAHLVNMYVILETSTITANVAN